MGGDAIGVADLKLCLLMQWFIGGGLDHVPAVVFAAKPRLMAWYEAIRGHDKVVAWYAR